MIYRPYGRTGCQVSAVGFGAMRFPDQEDREACVALVHAAYAAGINYFDTAIGYGKSEEILGEAFRDMRRTRAERPWFVSSKTAAQDGAGVRRDLETTLGRLGLEQVDFYHVWCLMNPEDWRGRRARGVLQEFEKLRAEGLVRHVVASSHMTGADIGDLLRDYPFEGVLLGYSAMNFHYRERALEAAAGLGRAVVVMNPLGGGLIPQFPERFGFVRTRPEETVVQGALRFLLNDPRITTALVGFSTQAQVAEAVSAVDGFLPIPVERVAQIRADIKEAFDAMCTGCGYCDDCPAGIRVPRFMDAYNHHLMQGGAASAVNRLAWHWGVGPGDDPLAACTSCRRCEEACTQHLPILSRFDELRRFRAEVLAERAKAGR